MHTVQMRPPVRPVVEHVRADVTLVLPDVTHAVYERQMLLEYVLARELLEADFTLVLRVVQLRSRRRAVRHAVRRVVVSGER